MKVFVRYTNNKSEAITFKDKEEAGAWFEANQHRILEYVIYDNNVVQKGRP